jgi:hypothetical protein
VIQNIRVAVRWKFLTMFACTMINLLLYYSLLIIPADAVGYLFYVVIAIEDAWFIATSIFAVARKIENVLVSLDIDEHVHAHKWHAGLPWWRHFISDLTIDPNIMWRVHHIHIHWLFPKLLDYLYWCSFINRLLFGVVLFPYSMYLFFGTPPSQVIGITLIGIPYFVFFFLVPIGLGIADFVLLLHPNSKLYETPHLASDEELLRASHHANVAFQDPSTRFAVSPAFSSIFKAIRTCFYTKAIHLKSTVFV